MGLTSDTCKWVEVIQLEITEKIAEQALIRKNQNRSSKAKSCLILINFVKFLEKISRHEY